MTDPEHIDLRHAADVESEALDRREEAVQSREDTALRREGTAQLREQAVEQRERSVAVRERAAATRDKAAVERDSAAAARDDRGDERDRAREDATAPLMEASSDPALRAELAEGRDDRVAAADDRSDAASDREASGDDRSAAEADRAAWSAESEQAAYDDLTGTLRRGPGYATLRNYLALAERTDQPFAVAFIDLVGLKVINDSQGHDAGDRALKIVADVLHKHRRDYDAVVRFGGDEFVVGLVGATESVLQSRLAAITAELAEKDVTVTIGLAERHDDSDLEELISRADQHLLQQRAGPSKR